MILNNIENMSRGWFIGDFDPVAFKTKDFEVGYKLHKRGELYGKHYHTKTTEINLVVSGKMKMQDKEFSKGDIFIVNPYEISDPVFFEDTEVICVRYPGIINDKISIEVTE